MVRKFFEQRSKVASYLNRKPSICDFVVCTNEAEVVSSRGYQTFADVISRELGGFEQYDVKALANESSGRIGPGRTTADDQNLSMRGRRWHVRSGCRAA